MNALLEHEDPAVRLIACRAYTLDSQARYMKDPDVVRLYGDAAGRMALGYRAASRAMLALARDIAEGREVL